MPRKRRWWCTFLLAVMVVSLPSRGVAQTLSPQAAPPPTAAPDDSLPAGAALIDSMYRAMRRIPSVHIAATASYGDPLVESMSFIERQDLSVKWQRLRSRSLERVVSMQQADLTRQTTQQVMIVGRLQAARVNDHHWTCAPLTQQSPSRLQPIHYWRHIRSAFNQGAETVDGIAAWHVTAVDVEPAQGPQLAVFTVLDYAIAQRGHRLVRQIEHRTQSETFLPGTLARYTLVTDYSAYGEAVTASLPAACLSTS